MIRKFPIFTFMLFWAMTIMAQTPATIETRTTRNIFNRLDISVTGGSTGFGFDFAAPVGNYVRLRAGFDMMPKFEKMMNFGIQVGDDAASSHNKFVRMSELLASITGNYVDESIDVIGKPRFYNFKLLVDIYPFQKKNWYFTTGFYVGPRQIADAYNTTEDMPTLFSVSLYNHIYEMFAGHEPEYWLDNEPIPGYSMDYFVAQELHNRFKGYGRMGVHMGNYSHDIEDEDGNVIHREGEPYIMEPDATNMVKAYVRTNAFKPYVGLGYTTQLDNRYSRYNSGWAFSVDAGIWLWGGTPSIVDHDGTDLAKDLCDIPGKVGRYVDIVKSFKVYPVLNLRLTKSIDTTRRNHTRPSASIAKQRKKQRK